MMLESFKQIKMIQGTVLIKDDFFSEEEANSWFEKLLVKIRWKQETIKIFNKTIPQPRLTAWYGDSGKTYTYSGITLQPEFWHPELLELKGKIEAAVNFCFNSVLLNLYRGGKDSMSWHRDNESELGKNPVIASLSLGAARRFQLKHKYRKDLEVITLNLTHGSLLIMAGSTQDYWLHRVPKTSKPTAERINLTFRNIVN